MNVEDPVTKQIYAMLQEKPRRLAELQKDLPLSKFGVINRMNRLEAMRVVVAERSRLANSTVYRLANGED